MRAGKLYLIPSFLNEPDPSLIPEQTKNIVNNLHIFMVEDARSARRFLRAIGYPHSFDTRATLYELNKHGAPDCDKMFALVKRGNSAGLISEAGCPCVADPGAELVAYAHRHRIEVVPLIGPSAVLLALMASGLNGQSFCFAGYLPIKEPERSRKIREIESAARNGTTQIFMETPYRAQKIFEELLRTLKPDTRLCVAANLTLPGQYVFTTTVAAWKNESTNLNKQYCMFLLG
ncbi:MAG: SAM-dependent methyltransferase [Chitinophagales bacterium]|nr:SAM-dependent methyltransferase [Chitinophagales bacterium]MDW8417767.1 SAM-dependent methyltransferase [Chitinophagales bacterium]